MLYTKSHRTQIEMRCYKHLEEKIQKMKQSPSKSFNYQDFLTPFCPFYANLPTTQRNNVTFSNTQRKFKEPRDRLAQTEGHTGLTIFLLLSSNFILRMVYFLLHSLSLSPIETPHTYRSPCLHSLFTDWEKREIYRKVVGETNTIAREIQRSKLEKERHRN